jgi:hypothetical protein
LRTAEAKIWRDSQGAILLTFLPAIPLAVREIFRGKVRLVREPESVWIRRREKVFDA